MQLKTESRHTKGRTLQIKSLIFIRNLRKQILFNKSSASYVPNDIVSAYNTNINRCEGFHSHWNIRFFQLHLRFLISLWPWNPLTTGSHQGHRLSDPYETKHHTRNAHILNARARVPLEKLPVPHLVKIFPPVLLNPKSHYSVNNIMPSVPILSQINPVKPFWPISLRSILNHPPNYT